MEACRLFAVHRRDKHSYDVNCAVLKTGSLFRAQDKVKMGINVTGILKFGD